MEVSAERPAGEQSVFARIRNWFPRGQTLPDEVWIRRHHALVGLLIAQGVGLLIFGLAEGFGLPHTLLDVGILVPVAVAAIAFQDHRRLAAVLVAVGLATESALLVHLWHGAIEAHFMFFVLIVVLALYEDWLPFLVAAGYVLVHHGVAGMIDPASVYNHPDAIAHPWKWASIHALFVISAGIGAIVAWRENERVRAQANTEHRKARESQERFRRGFDSAPIGMALTTVDVDGPEFVQVNHALSRITGYSADELVGRDYRSLIHEDDLPSSNERLSRYASGDLNSAEIETRFVHSDGHIIWVVVSVAVLGAEEDERPLAIAQIQDVTEQKLASERLSREAMHDALTGLPNRRSLMADLEARMKERGKHSVPLLLFDLDGFKAYNDTFGHPAGDALLTRASHRLRESVKGRATAYRMGGDEFCVLGLEPGCDADDLIARATRALTVQGDSFTVGSSVGSVMVPEEAASASEALGLADRRMYARKRSARSSPEKQSTDVLLQILSERDPSLGAHLNDVAQLCEEVAIKLEMPDEAIGPLLQAASLHDVGKAAIPDEILVKPGPLDVEEWALMRQHTLIGERILIAAPALAQAARLVRWSHERWDGHGYPDGIFGEQIPLGSRIIAVCDAYDAMTADRPYRAANSADDAIEELRRCSGAQFDPAVVKAFEVVLSERDSHVPAT